MDDIIFSFIIPTYNRGHFLIEAIRSILDQNFLPLEIIVIDDGGTDNTGELIENLGEDRIRYIKTVNRERGAGRNLGLSLASGIFVNYFDSDDLLNPCCEDVNKFLEEHNYPDVVYGGIAVFGHDNNFKNVVGGEFKLFKKSLLFNNFLACGSVFIKREVANQFLFSEDRRLSGTEDWELWLRVHALFDFVQMPFVIFQQREHSERSLRSTDIIKIKERELIFAQLLNSNHSFLRNRFSHKEIDLLIADRYTLIALAHAEGKAKNQAFDYLLTSLKTTPQILKRKRFWAVTKKLILS